MPLGPATFLVFKRFSGFETASTHNFSQDPSFFQHSIFISTNTFTDVDIFLYKMFTFRSPVRGASSQHSYFFAKNNISY